MERLDDPLLNRPIQVDQEVAAGDQIEVRERRIADDVVRGEQHQLAQLTPYPVAPGLAHEEALQALLREIGDVGVRIEGLSCARRSPARRDRWRTPVSAAARGRPRSARRAAWQSNRPPRRWRTPEPRRESGRAAALSSMIRGSTFAVSASNASGSRKKLVTLMSSSFISVTASSGFSRRNRA